jgi:hypothetical protein
MTGKAVAHHKPADLFSRIVEETPHVIEDSKPAAMAGMGKYVFRHADPARTEAEGNARDAGPRRGHFALETNAYGQNVFHDFAEMDILEPSGRWLRTFDDFKGTLQKNKGLLCEFLLRRSA